MKKILGAVIILTTFSIFTMAAERKPLKEVETDEFITDTQVTPLGTGDNHSAIVWWIPNEFWQSIMARDTNTSDSDKKAMLDAMEGVSLLAIVQADISSFGAFKFYSKEEIEENMVLSYSDADEKKQRLTVMQTINPDLEIVLGVFKPIMGSALGNLGNNVHFYVLDDRLNPAQRLIDPYLNGQIDIQLTRRDGTVMDAVVETPINALYVPRKCPNGKNAHISWKYCPWSGKQLEE